MLQAATPAPAVDQPEAPLPAAPAATLLPPAANTVMAPAPGAGGVGGAGLQLPRGRAVVDIDSGNPAKKQTKVMHGDGGSAWRAVLELTHNSGQKIPDGLPGPEFSSASVGFGLTNMAKPGALSLLT